MDDDEVLQKMAERLDYIEEYLVHLGQVSGYRYGRFTSVSLPPSTSRATSENRSFRPDTNVGRLVIENGADGVRLYLVVSGELNEDIMVFGQEPFGRGRYMRRNVSYLD